MSSVRFSSKRSSEAKAHVKFGRIAASRYGKKSFLENTSQQH